MRTTLILSIGTVFCLAILVACGPRTYEDCVLKALEGSSKSDSAVYLIRDACREKFPVPASKDPVVKTPVAAKPAVEPVVRPKPLAGIYYHESTRGDTCKEIVVYANGTVKPNFDRWGKHAFFCDKNSLFERLPDGELTFACLDFKGQGESRVFDAERLKDGIQLSEGGRNITAFYDNLATCVRGFGKEESK